MISIREDFNGAAPSAFELEVEQIFSETGLLSQGSGFEYRAEQQRMAVAVARTLETGSHLVVEAGTGVGKSLAYLIPAAMHAVRTKKKGGDFDAHDRAPRAALVQGHSSRAKNPARRLRGGAAEGASKFSLHDAPGACDGAGEGIVHDDPARRTGADSRVESDHQGRVAKRFSRAAGAGGMGGGAQRAAPVHAEDMRSGKRMLLPGAAPAFGKRAGGGAQPRVVLHSAEWCGTTPRIGRAVCCSQTIS
jgi:hypothetical protein